MNEDFKKRDRDRHRWKYHFDKCVAVGLIPHVLDSEQKLRNMYKEWKEAQGRVIIPDGEERGNGPEPIEMGDTTISEFYKVKRAHELDKDTKWNKELRNIREADEGGTYSERSERLRWGESSLIFDIGEHKTIPFPSDSDTYLIPRRKRKEKKKKSTWNFFNEKRICG